MTADQFAELLRGILDRQIAPLMVRLTSLETELDKHRCLTAAAEHEPHLAAAMRAMRVALAANRDVLATCLRTDGFTEPEILAAEAYMRDEHARWLTAARGELVAAVRRAAV